MQKYFNLGIKMGPSLDSMDKLQEPTFKYDYWPILVSKKCPDF